MSILIVSKGQCMIDIAIQAYGDIATLFDLAKDNNLEVDDDLTPGQVLQIRDTLPDTANPDLAAYFTRNGIIVNSGATLTLNEVLATNDGNGIGTNNGEFISA